MNPVDLLKLRYATTLESTSDVIFYRNIHSYIKLIIGTPLFMTVIKQAESDYYASTKKNGRTTYKLEEFNLYTANYLNLYLKIYSPLESYIPTFEPDTHQDPVALLLAFGIKSPQVEDWCKNNRRGASYKEAKKDVKTYHKWIGKRAEYETHLKQFHVNFLTKFAQQEEDITSPSIPTTEKVLTLHPRTGDFRFYKTSGDFNPKSQEFNVLTTLMDSDDYLADYTTLIKSYRPNSEATKTEKQDLSQVIKRIKEKLEILPISETSNPDIFDNVKSVGYKLILEKTD